MSRLGFPRVPISSPRIVINRANETNFRRRRVVRAANDQKKCVMTEPVVTNICHRPLAARSQNQNRKALNVMSASGVFHCDISRDLRRSLVSGAGLADVVQDVRLGLYAAMSSRAATSEISAAAPGSQ
jgi:hypothetical protein